MLSQVQSYPANLTRPILEKAAFDPLNLQDCNYIEQTLLPFEQIAINLKNDNYVNAVPTTITTNPRNTIMAFVDKNNRTYYAEVKYDSDTNQIFAPEN